MTGVAGVSERCQGIPPEVRAQRLVGGLGPITDKARQNAEQDAPRRLRDTDARRRIRKMKD